MTTVMATLLRSCCVRWAGCEAKVAFRSKQQRVLSAQAVRYDVQSCKSLFGWYWYAKAHHSHAVPVYHAVAGGNGARVKSLADVVAGTTAPPRHTSVFGASSSSSSPTSTYSPSCWLPLGK